MSNQKPISATMIYKTFGVHQDVIKRLLKNTPVLFQAPYAKGTIQYWDAAVAEPIITAYLKKQEASREAARKAAETPPLPVEPPKEEPPVARLTEMFRRLEVMDATLEELPGTLAPMREDMVKLHQQNILLMRKLNEVHDLMSAVLEAVTKPA